MTGPALDDLLGQMNQHQLGLAIIELAKGSQQAKVEQGQQRAGRLRRSGSVSGVLAVRTRAMPIEGDIERFGDLYQPPGAAMIELIRAGCGR